MQSLPNEAPPPTHTARITLAAQSWVHGGTGLRCRGHSLSPHMHTNPALALRRRGQDAKAQSALDQELVAVSHILRGGVTEDDNADDSGGKQLTAHRCLQVLLCKPQRQCKQQLHNLAL